MTAPVNPKVPPHLSLIVHSRECVRTNTMRVEFETLGDEAGVAADQPWLRGVWCRVRPAARVMTSLAATGDGCRKRAAA